MPCRCTVDGLRPIIDRSTTGRFLRIQRYLITKNSTYIRILQPAECRHQLDSLSDPFRQYNLESQQINRRVQAQSMSRLKLNCRNCRASSNYNSSQHTQMTPPETVSVRWRACLLSIKNVHSVTTSFFCLQRRRRRAPGINDCRSLGLQIGWVHGEQKSW